MVCFLKTGQRSVNLYKCSLGGFSLNLMPFSIAYQPKTSLRSYKHARMPTELAFLCTDIDLHVDLADWSQPSLVGEVRIKEEGVHFVHHLAEH